MAKNYEAFITELCSLIGFHEPQRLIQGEPIFLNDVMFSLIHDHNIDPGYIYLFTSFGDLPEKNHVKILEVLLKHNHAIFDGEGPGFTISPTTGKVVYSLHVPLAQTTPMELAAKMALLKEKALEWRETFFLNTTPAAARRPKFEQWGALS